MSDIPLSKCLTLDCEHKFCQDCLIQEWTYKITNNQYNEESLVCPFDKCKHPINYEQLREHLDRETFLKYEEFCLKTIANLSQNEVQFICPNPECQVNAIIWKDADYFSCPACKLIFCTKCQDTYHPKKSCDEYKQTKNLTEEEIATLKFIQENTTQCPKCHTNVQKEKYCNFMRCTSAQCQSKTCFCFICGDELDEKGHYDHFVNRDPWDSPCVTQQKYEQEGLSLKKKFKPPQLHESDNEEQKKQENKDPCPVCKTMDPAICEILANFENKFCSCKSEKCNNAIYCLNCTKKFNTNEGEYILQHLSKNNCEKGQTTQDSSFCCVF